MCVNLAAELNEEAGRVALDVRRETEKAGEEAHGR